MNFKLITLISFIYEVISFNSPSELPHEYENLMEANHGHPSLNLIGSRYLPTRLVRKDDLIHKELHVTMTDGMDLEKTFKLESNSESIISLPDNETNRQELNIDNQDNFITSQLQLRHRIRCRIKDQPKFSPNSTVGIINEAKRFAYLSGVAYCNDDSIQDWNCTHCVAVGGLELVKIVYDPNYHLRSIILLDYKNKDLIISFRGSDGFMQAFSLMSTSTESYMNEPNVKVQIKFKERTLALFNYLFVELDPIIKLYSCYRKVLIGHSLGGAMATLTAPLLHQIFQIPYSNLALYTYNQPRVGNLAFATWYHHLNLHTIRVVNRNDLVPHLLTYPSFVHTRQELFIDDNDTVTLCSPIESEDPYCSNHYSSYSLLSSVHNQVWEIGLGNDFCHVG